LIDDEIPYETGGKQTSHFNNKVSNDIILIRGGQPKLVFGPQLGNFALNIDFLGRNTPKN
jgi:hypothetical protein